MDTMKLRQMNIQELLEEDSKKEIKVVENKLIGECYINLNRLFREDIHAVTFNLRIKIFNKKKEGRKI